METRKMKVKLATLRAGPNGIDQVGAVIDVSENEAKYLIETHGAKLFEASSAPQMEQSSNSTEDASTENKPKREKTTKGKGAK